MFKAGEKVIHHRFGEGVLSDNNLSSKEEFPIFFASNGGKCCVLTIEGKYDKDDIYPSIYYVPQTLDMSKPEPAIGTWGYFWDESQMDALFASLKNIVPDKKEKYLASTGMRYENFSREIPPHLKELMNGTSTSNP